MEKTEYKNIFDHENSHFFYVSTHRLVLGLIEKYLPLPIPPLRKGRAFKILDAGCGTGGLMLKLKKYGEVTGIDFSYEAIRLAKKRKLKVIKSTIEKLPFKDHAFDLVISIDVIYHRQVLSDVKALKECRRVLKKDGYLILRVPANKFLMSAHDRHVHTMRRYDKKELINKMKQAGLKVKMVSFVHSPIFPVSLVKILIERINKKENTSSVVSVNSIINGLLTMVLGIEAKLIVLGIPIPIGQGLVVVATR